MSFISDYRHLRECLCMDQGCGQRASTFFFIRSLWNPCFSILYTFRLGTFLRKHKKVLFLPYGIVWLMHRYNTYKTGIQLEFGTQIKPGLSFAHFGSIVINPASKIGSNCLVYQGVTIGSQRGGVKAGAPEIGNNVMLSSGCKVIGKVKIGDNVIIGANAVVVKDVPSGAIAVGVPAKVINFDASTQLKDYIKINY